MSTEATAAAAIPNDPPAPPHALLSLPAAKLPMHVQPWTAALVGFLALALFGATAAGIFFKLRLDALGSNAAVTARQTSQLLEQVAALDAQERAIRAEGTELRQYIASNSAEQIIFLKMLVLKPDLDTALAHTIARHVHYYAALFYMEMYKDIEMALTAYNRGPGPVDLALMHGKDPKNKYAPEVLRVYERLKKLGLKDV